jgi:hypothetical protein
MTVLAIEDWRTVAECPDYEVNALGGVRRGARILKPWRHRSGHLYVGCAVDGAKRNRQVHRLVLCAFVGLPPTAAHEACHRDGNPANNAADNLYWGTRAQNIEDAARHRRRHAKSSLTFEQADNLRRAFNGRRGEKRRLARMFGLSESLVGRILNGQTYRRTA